MIQNYLIGIVAVIFAAIVGEWVYSRTLNHLASAHFKARCAEDGGEFIYKTIEDVEGFFLMRLRDPRDLITRLRERDIPEDPYGHFDFESQQAEYLFVSPPQRLYRYVEMPWRDFRYLQKPFKKIPMNVLKAPYLRF